MGLGWKTGLYDQLLSTVSAWLPSGAGSPSGPWTLLPAHTPDHLKRAKDDGSPSPFGVHVSFDEKHTGFLVSPPDTLDLWAKPRKQSVKNPGATMSFKHFPDTILLSETMTD